VYKSVKVLKGQCKRKAGKKKRRRKFGSSSKKRKLFIDKSRKRRIKRSTKDDFSYLLKRKRSTPDDSSHLLPPPLLQRTVARKYNSEELKAGIPNDGFQSTGNDQPQTQTLSGSTAPTRVDSDFWNDGPYVPPRYDLTVPLSSDSTLGPPRLTRNPNPNWVSVDDDDYEDDGFSQRKSKRLKKTRGEIAREEIKLFQAQHSKNVKDWERENPQRPFLTRQKRWFGKKKNVSRKKGPSAALKKLCKKLKVRLTTKRGKKRVYKSEKVLKKQCTKKRRRK
jgi:hypothetical protein